MTTTTPITVRTTRELYERLDTPEHQTWKSDRDTRQRMPPSEAWRGCVGLAALLGDPDLYVECGTHRLVPNFNISWLALRDVPIGHFLGSAVMNRRDVSLATMATAARRYGMPCIDFTASSRDTWDLRFIPFGRYRRKIGPALWDDVEVEAAGDTLHSADRPREFAVLNRLSAAMTRFAYCGVDHRGYDVRPAWAARRPAGMVPEPVARPPEWFPRAYLGFHVGEFDEVLKRAMLAEPHGSALQCCRCGKHVDAELFRRRPRSLHVHTAGGNTEDFIADCPACQARQKWRATEAIPAATHRQFPIAFRERFCRSVAEGLPLRSIGPSVYCGAKPLAPERDYPNLSDAVLRGVDLVAHRFLCQLTGRRHIVYLPPSARIEVRQGQTLQSGHRWCRAMPGEPPAAWRGQDRIGRWNALGAVLGGPGYVELLQMAWLRHQAVMHEELGNHQFLLPADLVGLAGMSIRPLCTFWDFRYAKPYVDVELAAAVFPPLRLHRWNDLRFNLPGDVAMDASIVDPRADMHRRSELPTHPTRRSPGDDNRKGTAVILPMPSSTRPMRRQVG